ncbi:MAG TPA: hypothetical protein VNK04_07115, partial [Gemmataceae bacterium]|nr:hypothetical protein [Gemmataceae bacterium]
MRNHPSFFLGAGLGLAVLAGFSALYGNQVTGPKRGRLNVNPPHISTDPSVKYDYDIVYVRAPRDPSGEKPIYFAEVNNPLWMTPGADLMLLHPDGSEEVLVPGGKGAVMDPAVSFDGEWVYYCYIYDLTNARRHEPPPRGADIYKIHVKTRKVVRLTQQVYTPNTGAAYWLGSPPRNRHEEGTNYLQYHGVFHTGPCPLPGGKVMFTSNRNAFIPPKHSSPCLQLFVMDDDGSNVEQVGFMNLGMALHPVILKDGRVMFSSLESQGLRASTLWGLWSIHPDGTNWGPMLSAFNYGSAAQTTHFQTQLSNGDIVIEEYYQQNNWGFGTYYKFPVKPPPGQPTFGPANPDDPRNGRLRVGRHGDGTPVFKALPFSPYGIESLTPFATPSDFPAGLSDPNDGTSPRVGKFTHPSGAPDNHLLTVWSPGPVNHNGLHLPLVDAGIYLIKDGKPIEEPGQMLLIKNDPNYNEQWPRALVPYKRIYGIDEPPRLP